MPPISIRKIITVIVIIILLSRIEFIIAFISSIYWAFYFSFKPLRNCPVEAKYVVVLLFFALIWVTIFKLFYRK